MRARVRQAGCENTPVRSGVVGDFICAHFLASQEAELSRELGVQEAHTHETEDAGATQGGQAYADDRYEGGRAGEGFV